MCGSKLDFSIFVIDGMHFANYRSDIIILGGIQ